MINFIENLYGVLNRKFTAFHHHPMHILSHFILSGSSTFAWLFLQADMLPSGNRASKLRAASWMRYILENHLTLKINALTFVSLKKFIRP
ncbi:MAG: hypothetical protein ACJAVR_002904 [Paracoccaceae bacterium]|jgi:hypothetical protein